jgi:HTH-type transcriptional regulator / antitoxin HipB
VTERFSGMPPHDRAAGMVELAETVRTRREALGLRQEEVADLAEVSERFVYALEAGKPTVRLDKLLDVLDALGLHLVVARGASPTGVVSEIL